MTDLLEYGRKVLAEQAFSCLVGAKLLELEPGRAALSVDLLDKLKQQHGFAHGGVLSYLADNSMTYAGATILGDSVTAEYKINYVRPATGEQLIARAAVVESGRTQAVCRCEIVAVKDGSEKIVALAQGTISKISPAEQDLAEDHAATVVLPQKTGDTT